MDAEMPIIMLSGMMVDGKCKGDKHYPSCYGKIHLRRVWCMRSRMWLKCPLGDTNESNSTAGRQQEPYQGNKHSSPSVSSPNSYSGL